MTAEERDINDLFDDIVLTEERLKKKSYDEGHTKGQTQGNLEGYKLGYAQGVQLGQELGEIYGTVIAHLQLTHTERVHKTLLQLKQAIDAFPRTNDPEQDIIGAVEDIRTINKRLRAMLRLTKTEVEETAKTSTISAVSKERRDYSF